jgi:hypothetical protein
VALLGSRGRRGGRRRDWGRARRKTARVFIARCPRAPRGHRPSSMSVPREGHAAEIPSARGREQRGARALVALPPSGGSGGLAWG